ncbi:MAG: hypothetical protein MI747_04185 [Desulfobacterales bacterium]|nr:hypothetical protein [Desulfobacterales bacterium]
MAEYLELFTTAALEEDTIAACTDLLLACPLAPGADRVLERLVALERAELAAYSPRAEKRARSLVKKILALTRAAGFRDGGLGRDGYYLLISKYQALLRRDYGRTSSCRDYFGGPDFKAFCSDAESSPQRLARARATLADHAEIQVKLVRRHFGHAARSSGFLSRYNQWKTDWHVQLSSPGNLSH